MADAGPIAVVDQGSTSTKAAVVGPGDALRDLRRRPIGRRTDGVRVEHDPEEILASVRSLLAELEEEHHPAAVGLTCQRSTCLLWDRVTGKPLTPAVSWQDLRAADRVAELSADAATVAERTGLRLSPHYAAGKLACLLAGLDRGLERAAGGELVAGTLDAFLVRGLTGRDATEPGHAGRTLLWNLATGRWDPELCALFGIPEAALPEVLPSAGPRGERAGSPLVAVAGDQQAALLAQGGWEAGAAALHLGTGAFVLAGTGAEPRRHTGLLTAVVASTPRTRRFQIEASVNAAGSAIDWICARTGEDLATWAEREIDPESLPLVLPGFAGVAAPWWRSDAAGVVAGLRLATGSTELVGATLAGVALRIVDGVSAIRAAGVPLTTLRAGGRLARLSGLVGLIADAGEIVVERDPDEESGLTGIARLARVGAGGEESGLAGRGPALERRTPRWDGERAHRTRERWRAFVARAVELA